MKQQEAGSCSRKQNSGIKQDAEIIQELRT